MANLEQITRTPNVASADWTMEAWIKFVSWPAATARVCFLHDSNGQGADVTISSAGALGLLTFANSHTGTGSTLSLDTWYYLSFEVPHQVGSSDAYHVYLNGSGTPDVTATDWGSNGTQNLCGWAGSKDDLLCVDCRLAYTRQFPTLQDGTAMTAEMNSATAVQASPTYDDTLLTDIGGWTGHNTPTTGDSDNPSFGGGGGGGSDGAKAGTQTAQQRRNNQ
jgi:hypothetical protein